MTLVDPSRPGRSAEDPLTVAFYLPQFHAIPENDRWWGEGFTEWTNVRRARPQFDAHLQPAVPEGPHGEYNLLDPEVVAWQAKLAQENDIDAFCYYHYWFDGHRLLESPADNYLRSGESMPFCIAWANENWSRRWDGKDKEVLMAQRYDESTPRAVFESFLPYLSDARYLRRDGRLVLLVHRVDHLPSARGFAETWREQARSHGLGELWLVASETSSGLDPHVYGFDAVAEFAPVGDNTLSSMLPHRPAGLARSFKGRLMSYERLMDWYVQRPSPAFPRHRGLVPRWDNTPRRQDKSTIFVGATPDLYAQWLAAARAAERAARPGTGLVFVNAWNEWAEGAYLEPDAQHGDAYLRASRWDYSGPVRPIRSTWRTEGFTLPHWRTAAMAAASSLNNARKSLRRVPRG